jgi:hypothetical protein
MKKRGAGGLVRETAGGALSVILSEKVRYVLAAF